ncbi:dTDP-4-dehydrorhamnose 3,5-epimerase [Isoptericola sp. NPDC019482]|uniref:dTDP-4-dehydrorhamnose 3,5-epimerase family protein n=1 Tax=Isoptericola sp. NPDC019482 TaxID=3154688 RepID=UPI003488927A
MEVHATTMTGPLLFTPSPHRDARGFFTRTFDADVARTAGLDPFAFVQDNQSRSSRGVVRGMHGRIGAGEAKLVRVAHGAVLDVIVDARPDSATYGDVEAFLLDDESFHVLYVPRGFLHGHQTLTDTADVCYRIDAEHDPAEDVAVHHLDPDLAVPWPLPVSLVSDRDAAAGSWTAFAATLTASDRRPD